MMSGYYRQHTHFFSLLKPKKNTFFSSLASPSSLFPSRFGHFCLSLLFLENITEIATEIKSNAERELENKHKLSFSHPLFHFHYFFLYFLLFFLLLAFLLCVNVNFFLPSHWLSKHLSLSLSLSHSIFPFPVLSFIFSSLYFLSFSSTKFSFDW